MTSPVFLTEAPARVPATRVPARTREDLRTIALVAPPSERPAVDLPLDLLAELGKRDDVAGRSSHSQDDTGLIPIWLTAHQTEWVIVTSPHVLTTPALQSLATLTLPTGARLLLACDHQTGQQVHHQIADYSPTRIAWDDLPNILPPPGPTPTADTTGDRDAGAEAETGDWTDRDLTLPREDWPTFRSGCRKLLHPDTFDTVDRVYVHAFQTARAWLRSNEPTEDSTAELVGTIMGQASNLDHAITVLRACQAAYMDAGWSLRADLDTAITGVSQRPVAFTADQWRSLRAYRQPYRAAAVTLHQHGYTVARMHQLRLGDLAADSSTACETPVDPRGRAYLTAHRLHRQADGTTLDDPLFTDAPRSLLLAIRDARSDLMLRLGPGRLSLTEHPGDRWQRRLGLTIWDRR